MYIYYESTNEVSPSSDLNVGTYVEGTIGV
jgi:hypothetical protein